MKKQDIKFNSQRITFSKKIKRRVLLEIAKNRKPREVFCEVAFSNIDEVSSDKKYISKLVHKWRKELYNNKAILSILNQEVDINSLDYEIETLLKVISKDEKNYIFNDKEEDFVRMINKA